MYTLQLRGASPSPFARPPRPHPDSNGMFLFAALIVFCAGGYALFHYAPLLLPRSDHKDVAPPAVEVKATSTTIPLAEAEDLVRHLEDALIEEGKAAGEIKRSEEWIDRVTPSMRQNFMALEMRRLRAASIASESARRHIEQARQELRRIL